MRRGFRAIRRLVFLTLVLWPLLIISGGDDNEALETEPQTAVVLTIEGPIGPATTDYFKRGMREAQARNAGLVILEMDTPGGLDDAMRDIIRDIIASPIPVAVYVSPSGSRAASAGTYILYASHVAAMAPGTNLGAATPVQMGGPGGPADEDTAPEEDSEADNDDAANDAAEEPAKPRSDDPMRDKLVEDAVAYIKGLAELRGRNKEWAEKAVREAASLSSNEALEKGVIEFIARDVRDLLQQIDGVTADVGGQDRVLETAGLGVEYVEPDWRNRLLAVITNPNVAYILMLIGIYGLIFEFSNPGYIVPGVTGAISLLLALYAFQVLPVNYAGLGLMLLGIAFMVGEVFVPSFGALGIAGVIAFVIGSIIMFDTGVEGYEVSLPLIIGVAIVSAGFCMGVIGMAARAWRRPVVTGPEEMVGDIGEALEDFEGTGRIHIHGETWRAVSDVPVTRGQRLRVKRMEGLKLFVEPQQGSSEEAE